MKPIRNNKTAGLGNLKMCREELDELVEKFEQLCEKVTISDSSNQEYENLEELGEYLEKHSGSKVVKDIEIRGENPGVRFLFNHKETVGGPHSGWQFRFNEIRTDETTNDADAVYGEIRDFLLKHIRPKFRRGWIVPSVLSLVGVFWFASHNSHIVDKDKIYIGAPIIFLVFLVVFGTCFAVGASTGNFMTLETRRNSSFFAKYREDFAKQGVTAVISGAIGLIFGLLLGHLLK